MNVVEKMKSCSAVIGGEGNGGIIYPESHYGRDALVGIGLLIGLILSWVMNLPGGDIFIWIFCLFLGLKVGEIILSDEDKDADCTIITTIDNLVKLRNGDLNPMSAFMTGKVKVKGDMGLAMKLQSLFG